MVKRCYLTVGLLAVLSLISLASAAFPVVSSVNLSPEYPDDAEDLYVTVISSDAEGDNITLWYEWYRNSTLNATTVISDGLVSYWSFNNDTYDYWGSNDGTPVGDPSQTSGKVGNAYTFDGNDYVNTNSIMDLTSGMTLSAWVNRDVTGAWDVIFSNWQEGTDNGYIFAIPSDDLLYFYTKGTWHFGTITIGTGWHHVAVTQDGSGNKRFFIDGLEDGTAQVATVPDVSPITARIGVQGNLLSNYFNGEIDEMMVFNTSLSALQINQLYQGSRYGGDVMNNTETTSKDHWYVRVRGGDSSGFGNPTNSNEVIVDPPPIVNSVTLAPICPSVDDDIVGTIDAYDPDGDDITFWYKWYRNGTLNATTILEDTTSLVGYWPFNNDSLDYWNNYNGTNYGAILTSGIVGGAYDFENDYISIPDNSKLDILDHDFAFSLWIKNREIGVLTTFVNKRLPGSTSYTFRWEVNNTLRFLDSAGQKIRSSTALSQDTWYHVVISVDRNNASNTFIYINGTDDTDPAPIVSNASYDSTGPLEFGRWSGDGAYLNGTLDEIMYFNKTLTSSEVKQLYYGSRYGGHTMSSNRTQYGDLWKLGVIGGDYLWFGSETQSNESQVNCDIGVTLEYYCPSIVKTNETFVIWADYEANGTDILDANITLIYDTNTSNLVYSPARSRYDEWFVSNIQQIWIIQMNISKAGYVNQQINCTIRIEDPFNLTIRLWEEVELSTYANTSKYIVTQKNYNKQLTDPYINDFAYVIAKNNDFNATGVYEYCNFPFKAGQQFWNALSIPNYMEGRPEEDASADLKNLLGSWIGCNQYWYRAEYDQGEAVIQLPYYGNYSIYFLEGTLEWENNVSPPKILKSDMFIHLGEIYIPRKQAFTLDFWMSHYELDFWGTFSNDVFVFFVTIFPLLLFVFLILTGMSVKTAGMIAMGWEIIWMIIRGIA